MKPFLTLLSIIIFLNGVGQTGTKKITFKVLGYADTINKYDDGKIIFRLENNSEDSIFFSSPPYVYFARYNLNAKKPGLESTEKLLEHTDIDYVIPPHREFLAPGQFRNFETHFIFYINPKVAKYKVRYFFPIGKV